MVVYHFTAFAKETSRIGRGYAVSCLAYLHSLPSCTPTSCTPSPPVPCLAYLHLLLERVQVYGPPPWRRAWDSVLFGFLPLYMQSGIVMLCIK